MLEKSPKVIFGHFFSFCGFIVVGYLNLTSIEAGTVHCLLLKTKFSSSAEVLSNTVLKKPERDV